MPRIAYFAAAVLWAAVVGPFPLKAAETKASLSLDELVEYFDSIVFQSETKGAKPSKVVKKWTQPLRVAIRSFEEDLIERNGCEILRLKRVKVKKPHLRFIKRHLNSLIKATKLKTEDAKKTGEPPNFMINFVPRRQMANPYLAKANPKLLKRLASEGGCYFLFWDDGATGKINKAVIVVNSERLLIRINHCLLEKMTQALGLPNDSNRIEKSIFSDRSRRTELARTDLIVLKTLYDPRMKAGLPRAEAVAVAREIIRDLDAALP